MKNFAFLRGLYAKCKMHGSGDAQIIITDSELYTLICIAVNDLDWSFEELGLDKISIPSEQYYQIPLSWFDEQDDTTIQAQHLIYALGRCFEKNNDFGLYIENLSALHRRRIK